MQFTPEFYERDVVAGGSCLGGVGACALQVVDVAEYKVLVVKTRDVTEVYLAAIEEDGLQLTGINILALGFWFAGV